MNELLNKHALPVSMWRKTGDLMGFFLVILISTLLLANQASAADSLNVNQSLSKNGFLSSPNERYRLTLQIDGNLVLRDVATGTSLWSTKTTTGETLTMQPDGNLVLRIAAGSALWSSGTAATTATQVKVFDNGALAMMQSTSVIATIYGTVPSAPTTPTTSTKLPLEVLGRRSSASMTLNLPGSGFTHLYVQCHSCGYGNAALDKGSNVKASVRINGGSWIKLKHYTGNGASANNNPNIAVMKPESAYGSIGGAFHTVRFTLSTTALKTGANTIEFQHTNPDKRSLGFRIIDLDAMRGTVRMLGKGAIALDNPATWAAPIDAATETDRAAGATLWRTNNILIDPFVAQKYGTLKGQTVPGKIYASCSNCHARDGRDLKYFRFSNDSIIERSVFHGLSDKQGKQIAAYIRKLTTPAPAMAWPWNPPYQPGAGIDNRNVTDWAAGAGVDAVLNRDADMRNTMFPGAIDSTTVANLVNVYGNLNMRQLPVALQFPDWNAWLPRLHPLDGFNRTAAPILRDRNGTPTSSGLPLFEHEYQAAATAKSNARIDSMAANIRLWLTEGASCFTQNKTSGANWRPSNSTVLRNLGMANAPNVSTTNCDDIYDKKERLWGIEDVKMGLAAWMNVKQWEIIHGNNLEQPSYPSIVVKGRTINVNEKFGWGLEERNVFNRAAHFLAYNSITFIDEDTLVSTYGSTVWYHLQMVLDSGYRKWMPSHFSYTLSYIDKLDELSNESQSFRFWATMAKMRQQHTNGKIGIEQGFSLHNAQPFHLYASTSNRTQTRSAVGTTLWRLFSNEILRGFLEQAEGTNYTHWENADDLEDVQDYTTAINPGSGDWDAQDNQGNNTARVMPLLRNLGGSGVTVDESLLTRLNTWSRGMWRNWGNK